MPSRRQLPADLADFAGRERETAELEALLSGDGAAAAITAIGGMGGIGKSALAVHVAHRLAARYPDGQLVIDMGGNSGEPLEPAAAMQGGVPRLDRQRGGEGKSGNLGGRRNI